MFKPIGRVGRAGKWLGLLLPVIGLAISVPLVQKATSIRSKAASGYIIITNTASGKSCDQLCANNGRICQSVGLNSGANDGKMQMKKGLCPWTPTQTIDCDYPMTYDGICPNGQKVQKTKCRCLDAN